MGCYCQNGIVKKVQFGLTTPTRYFETYCTCPKGRERARIDEEVRQPGYVNPFTGLSDQEILDLIANTPD